MTIVVIKIFLFVFLRLFYLKQKSHINYRVWLQNIYKLVEVEIISAHY